MCEAGPSFCACLTTDFFFFAFFVFAFVDGGDVERQVKTMSSARLTAMTPDK